MITSVYIEYADDDDSIDSVAYACYDESLDCCNQTRQLGATVTTGPHREVYQCVCGDLYDLGPAEAFAVRDFMPDGVNYACEDCGCDLLADDCDCDCPDHAARREELQEEVAQAVKDRDDAAAVAVSVLESGPDASFERGCRHLVASLADFMASKLDDVQAEDLEPGSTPEDLVALVLDANSDWPGNWGWDRAGVPRIHGDDRDTEDAACVANAAMPSHPRLLEAARERLAELTGTLPAEATA